MEIAENCEVEIEIKIYRRRWIILMLYCSLAITIYVQCYEYSIINNIVSKYYNVSSKTVDWTSIMFMIASPLLVTPVMYVADHKGLRVIILATATVATIGSVVKLFSFDRESFWVVLVAQCFVCVCHPPIMTILAKVPAVWFGPGELSRACGIGIMAIILGDALGLFIPSVLVRDHDLMEDIRKDLKILTWTVAVAMIPTAVAVTIFFQKEPPLPPNRGQLEERYGRKMDKNNYFIVYKQLLFDRGLVLQLVAFSLCVGCLSVFATFLNQSVLAFFPNSEADAGRLGLLSLLFGVGGNFLVGYILDKTHKYKVCNLVVCIVSCLSLAGFTLALIYKKKALLYVACVFYGFFLNSYVTVGVEMALELTFPVSEAMVVGLLQTSAQLFGALVSLFVGWILGRYGIFWALGSNIILLLSGTIVSIFIPNRLKRQKFINEGNGTNVAQEMNELLNSSKRVNER